jgi:hypothetical protein
MLPDISLTIKQMISENPADRPTLDEISQRLILPLQLNADLIGWIKVRKENCDVWGKK